MNGIDTAGMKDFIGGNLGSLILYPSHMYNHPAINPVLQGDAIRFHVVPEWSDKFYCES